MTSDPHAPGNPTPPDSSAPHSAALAWPARVQTWTARALLAAAAVLFVLHFVHLAADFPNHSPWSDWSKYTDEGWYSDAAVRQLLFGHWFFAGDFNPAVALPVWPALEFLVFRLTGVSVLAARALTLAVFAVTLAALYVLLARHTRPRSSHAGQPLAAALAVFLLAASPFVFVFERMAILEPLLICLTTLALLAASHLHPLRGLNLRQAVPTLALTLLLPALVLTKTTAIFLFPAISYMVWARAGYRLLPALRMALVPALGGLALWCMYFFLLVRPHYLEDYRYLFSANAYTGIALEPFSTVVLNTLSDGMWMGPVLYPCVFAALALVLFWRPRLLTNPLFVALLLWAGGYFAFLAYHNNLQPRYYLVAAVPITALVALALDDLRQPRLRAAVAAATPPRAPRAWASHLPNALALVIVLAIALPDLLQTAGFLLRPSYDFLAAARAIAATVRADKGHSDLIVSISGSDLTLMTGLPSINDDFGTAEFADRVRQYHPGWYVAWNDVEDDKADALTPLYNLERVAAYPAMDDPDRNLLILYRLDPAHKATAERPATRPRLRTPRPLVTKLGQQPSTDQLQH